MCVCVSTLAVLSSTGGLSDLDNLHRGEALRGRGSIAGPHFIKGHLGHVGPLLGVIQLMDRLPVLGQAAVGLLLLQRRGQEICLSIK